MIIETKDLNTGRRFLLPKIEDMHKLPSINLKPSFDAQKIVNTNKHLDVDFKNVDFKFNISSIKTNSENDFLGK